MDQQSTVSEEVSRIRVTNLLEIEAKFYVSARAAVVNNKGNQLSLRINFSDIIITEVNYNNLKMVQGETKLTFGKSSPSRHIFSFPSSPQAGICSSRSGIKYTNSIRLENMQLRLDRRY